MKPRPKLGGAAITLLLSACSVISPTPASTSTTTPPTSAASVTTSVETTPSLPDSPPQGICDSYGDPVAVGRVAISAVTEASGIAASRRYPGSIWMHNDSGGGPLLYATDVAGTDLGTFELDVAAFDWEDMAIGPGPDASVDYLYIGDIGDNLHFRPAVTVYRLPEPQPDPAGGSVDGIETFALIYPTLGPDAEAMMVDPVTGDIVVVTKEAAGEPAQIFTAPASALRDGAAIELEQIGTFELEPGAFVTSADIDSTGAAIVFRGYHEVWLWERTDLAMTETFASVPCRVPSTAEVQGEAIAFAPSGFSYYTISEGEAPDINFVESSVP